MYRETSAALGAMIQPGDTDVTYPFVISGQNLRVVSKVAWPILQ